MHPHTHICTSLRHKLWENFSIFVCSFPIYTIGLRLFPFRQFLFFFLNQFRAKLMRACFLNGKTKPIKVKLRKMYVISFVPQFWLSNSLENEPKWKTFDQSVCRFSYSVLWTFEFLFKHLSFIFLVSIFVCKRFFKFFSSLLYKLEHWTSFNHNTLVGKH